MPRGLPPRSPSSHLNPSAARSLPFGVQQQAAAGLVQSLGLGTQQVLGTAGGARGPSYSSASGMPTAASMPAAVGILDNRASSLLGEAMEGVEAGAGAGSSQASQPMLGSSSQRAMSMETEAGLVVPAAGGSMGATAGGANKRTLSPMPSTTLPSPTARPPPEVRQCMGLTASTLHGHGAHGSIMGPPALHGSAGAGTGATAAAPPSCPLGLQSPVGKPHAVSGWLPPQQAAASPTRTATAAAMTSPSGLAALLMAQQAQEGAAGAGHMGSTHMGSTGAVPQAGGGEGVTPSRVRKGLLFR